MGNLLSYSGLATKIRAMHSKLLTDQEYCELAEISSVPLAVAYLKQKPAYSQIWSLLDENDLHRGAIERQFVNAIYNDFARIYHFANVQQREFLDLYFKSYEISLLKNCLKKIIDHRTVDLDLSMFKTFFDRHSKLDINILAASASLEEFIGNLIGSEYYFPLVRLAKLQQPTLFDCEMALDLYYFSLLWKIKNKLFSKTDLKELTMLYGCKMDLLNLQWIYRSRQYYDMNAVEIYALIIPVYYKLKKSDIAALVEAEDSNAFNALLKTTRYNRQFEEYPSATLEELYNYIMKKVLTKAAKRSPHSVAIMYRYLYFKDHETRRLTVALECIRYGIPPDQTVNHIFKF